MTAHRSFADGQQSEASLREILSVGTSAGGARAKAIVAWSPSTHEIRSGQVDDRPDGRKLHMQSLGALAHIWAESDSPFTLEACP